jgi:hypothetical protein
MRTTFFLFLRSACAFSMLNPYTYSNMRACRFIDLTCAAKSANHVTSRHWMTKQPTRARIPKAKCVVKSMPRERIGVWTVS